MKTKIRLALNCNSVALLAFAALSGLVQPARAQLPSLGISNGPAGITVYWPVADADWSLQWTPSFQPINWSPFPATPSLSADEQSLTVLLDSSFQGTNHSAFFQLQSNSVPVVGPPTVVTTTNQFTCNLNKLMDGTVQPNGLDTTWWYQWGVVGGPTMTTATNVVSGTNTSPVDVEVFLTGLAPGTTYHFQLYASNADGITSGGDIVFSTAPLPGAITTGAGNVTGTSALLQGTANPQGSANGLVGYFQWGLTTSYGSNTPEFSDSYPNYQDASETYSLGGLQPNTTYHYRIVVFNCTGESVGTDKVFTTGSTQPQLPTVVTLGATSISSNCATLNGTVNPNGSAAGVDFAYGTNTGYGTYTGTYGESGSSTIPINVTVCGLLPGTTYHYRIEAGNGNGEAVGSDVTFTTLGSNCQLPSVQTDPAVALSPGSEALEAEVNPNGSDTFLYFEYGTTTNFANATNPGYIGNGNTTGGWIGTVTNLTPGTTYSCRAIAYNSCGTNYGATVLFTTTAASCPRAQTLYPMDITAHSVTLSGVVNPEGGAFAQFQWGTTTNYGNLTVPVNTGNGTSWQTFVSALSGLQANTPYNYRIVASNSTCVTFGTNVLFWTLPLPPIIVSQSAYIPDGGYGGGYSTANVNPNGGDTTVVLEWGMDTNNYPNVSLRYPIGHTSSVTVSNNWNQPFQVGTTIHFRAVATNPGGTTYGRDVPVFVQGIP